jgi:hypothetical protein
MAPRRRLPRFREREVHVIQPTGLAVTRAGLLAAGLMGAAACTRTGLECVPGGSRAPVCLLRPCCTPRWQPRSLTTTRLTSGAASGGRLGNRACWSHSCPPIGVEMRNRSWPAAGCTPGQGVSGGDLVTLCEAVWSFEGLLQEIAPTGEEDPGVAQLAVLVMVQQALDIRPSPPTSGSGLASHVGATCA